MENLAIYVGESVIQHPEKGAKIAEMASAISLLYKANRFNFSPESLGRQCFSELEGIIKNANVLFNLIDELNLFIRD